MTLPPALKIKIQIHCGEEIAMGPGKADLLDAIAAHGSIAAAGRAMGMSYRRAWMLVDVMNRCWEGPLVQTAPEGSARSGARVSPLGARVLAHYRALQKRMVTTAHCPDHNALSAAMRAAPLEKQGD